MNAAILGIVCGALAIITVGCSGGGGEGSDGFSPPDPGEGFTNEFETDDVVAEFELAAHGLSEFFLRATVPMPPGLFPLDSSESLFSIRDFHGNVVDAQVEIVSRYANPADGADVIEVLALVSRPQDTNSGDRIVYELIWRPSTPGVHQVDSQVQALLDTPGSLVLRTSDVFGHPYEADLLEDLRTNNPADLRVKRDGSVAHQVRTYENLEPVTPVSGSTGTLPHLMGVHSYITTWNDAGFFSIDLRVHNGHQGLDATTDEDDPMGKVYFNELELVVPDGWTLFQAFETPSFGSMYSDGATDIYQIVTPLGGGDLHVMRIQDQFHRRFVLCRDGWKNQGRSLLQEEGLAFCRDGLSVKEFRFLSWWNPVSARYFAQNLPLPDLSFLESRAESREQLRDDYQGVQNAFEFGTIGPWPITYPCQGWAHPWGPKSGGFQGGTEIYFWDGVRTAYGASLDGYHYFQTVHRMYTERHPTALYDRHGDAYNLESWVYQGNHGPILPTWILLIPWLPLGDPYGFTTAPTFQVDAVANQDRAPDYEDTLAGFDHIDTEHLIRYTRSAKVLAWLGNDALAKDDLQLQAELCRASYSILPQNEYGTGVNTGLLCDRYYVESNPNDGFDVNRGDGWIFDTASTYYALADPDWRTQARYWYDDVIDLVELGQSTCGGTIMSKLNTAHFSGQYRILQSISESILQYAMWGLRSTVIDGDDATASTRVNNILIQSTYAMISPQVWSVEDSSPHFYTALGPYDQSQPAFCGWVPPDGHEGYDNWQTWNVFSYGYLLTGDSQFLIKAGQMAGGGPLTVEAVLGNGNEGKVETRAGMIGMLQNLN